jgi:hypothetical protein
MAKHHFLTDDEQLLVEAILASAVTGLYRLSDLFGEVWRSIQYKTGFGIRFKRSVEAGQLSGIQTFGKTVENHQLYYVAQPAA